MTEKSEKAYKTIGEVAKILNLKSKKEGMFSTHTIRFWETQFKQIRPKHLNSNRRYYDQKTIDILKKIQHLLKNKGMTINGVRNYLNQVNSELDENNNKTINKNSIKIKIKNISNIIKNIKNNG